MASDARAQQAREHHRMVADALGQADQHRQQRDRLITALREDGWTYAALAKAVGCSPELVAAIVKGRTRK